MRNELIQHIQDIEAQKKSGLLMAVTQVTETDSVSTSATPVIAHFSFFFKEGVFATALCRGARGGPAISKIPAITAVTRVQFTATSPGTITVADKQVTTAQLLVMLGAQAVPAADQRAAEIREAQTRADAGQALKSTGEKVFGKVFGRAGKAMLQDVAARHDPARDPAGFLKACIAELSVLVGPQSAQDMMSA